MRPYVSVVIASYNHQEYVREAIESILSQGVSNIEIIVVDDGSADNTADEVEKIRDDRIKLIRLEENRKYHPRNLGISLAKGEYIAFQNSDDIWLKGKLKKQLNYLDQNPKTAACFTDVGVIDELGKPKNSLLAKYLFISKNKNRSRWLRYFFDIGNCLFISSSLIRKKAINEIGGFTPNLIRAADLDLWVRLAAKGEFYIIKEHLTQMRIIKDQNLSRPSTEAQNCSNMELAEIYENYAKEPILSYLPKVFEDIPHDSSKIKRLGMLALCGWKLSAPHILFANKIIGKIINDDQKRQELTKIFGAAIIKKYIKKRSQIELSLNKGKSVENIIQRSIKRLWQ